MSANDKPPYSPISAKEAESLSRGVITIAEEVISAIAAKATSKVQGVRVAGSSFRLGEFLSGKEGGRRGIAVRTDQESGHAEIDVDIAVKYGINIYEAASQVQRIVQEEVESLTGSLIIDKVNVRVRKTIMPEEEEYDESDRASEPGTVEERER